MGFTDTVPAPLSQGAGYGVLVGLGAGYAILMLLCTYWLKKFNGENNKSIETFAVAGRRVGTGLTTTAVLASWLWPNALLGATVTTWNFGFAGAYWFGAGCIVQIAFFALAAVQSKRRTPTALTVLQVVRLRYGALAHILYAILALANNLIAYVNMALASSATISALTGIDEMASLWLVPAATVFFVLSGGLKSTFLADYLHTASLLIIVLYLVCKTLANDEIGSINGLYKLVSSAAQIKPVDGNRKGSYLSLTSPDALKFATVHLLGNAGLVCLDDSYWQKAYAAGPENVVPAYLLGSFLYFWVPILLGGVMGLSAVGLSTSQASIWPVDRPLTDSEVANGMPLAYTVYAVAGRAGCFALLWMIYQAVTSSTSAEFVASGTIFAEDLMRYVRPRATERETIFASHFGVVLFALVATGVSIALWKINLNLTWLLYMLGIVTTPGMVTLMLTVLWRGQTKAAAIISPLCGVVAGVTSWLTLSAYYSGTWTVNVTTAGELTPCMWGTIVASCLPAILSPAISFLFPAREKFEWAELTEKLALDSLDSVNADIPPQDDKYLRRMALVSGWVGAVEFLVVWGVLPFALYGSRYIFSRSFFYGWVVVLLMGVVVTTLYVLLVPPWEGRGVIAKVARGALGQQAPASAASSATVAHVSEPGAGEVWYNTEKAIPVQSDLSDKQSA